YCTCGGINRRTDEGNPGWKDTVCISSNTNLHRHIETNRSKVVFIDINYHPQRRQIRNKEKRIRQIGFDVLSRSNLTVNDDPADRGSQHDPPVNLFSKSSKLPRVFAEQQDSILYSLQRCFCAVVFILRPGEIGFSLLQFFF